MPYKVLISPLVFGPPLLKELKTVETKEELDIYLKTLPIVDKLNAQAYHKLVLEFIPNTVFILSSYLINSLSSNLFKYQEQIYVVEVL